MATTVGGCKAAAVDEAHTVDQPAVKLHQDGVAGHQNDAVMKGDGKRERGCGALCCGRFQPGEPEFKLLNLMISKAGGELAADRFPKSARSSFGSERCFSNVVVARSSRPFFSIIDSFTLAKLFPARMLASILACRLAGLGSAEYAN